LQAQNLGSHRALSIIIKCKSEEPKWNMAKRRMRRVLVFSRNPQTLNELNPKFMSDIFKTLFGQIRLCIKSFWTKYGYTSNVYITYIRWWCILWNIRNLKSFGYGFIHI
jgi:hypothetical protein